jgi:hypothetical protein
MIIETSDNRFFKVTDCADADMAHLFHGIELKRVKGTWVEKTSRSGRHNWTYIRRAATRVVELTQ